VSTPREAGAVAGEANAAIYDALEEGEYVDGAPHLKHERLRAFYMDLAARVLAEAAGHRCPPRVLDLGAGEGTATLPFLEAGAEVTAVDVSERQLEVFRTRCGPHAQRLSILCGDVEEVIRASREAGNTYEVIVANSFLHHVPDPAGLIRSVVPMLAPRGILFSFQDPLRYRTLGAFTRAVAGLAYFWWRVPRGDVVGGTMRRARRMMGVYRDDCPQDNAEYHVVRSGVDHEALGRLLTEAGLSVELVRYFSTQSAWWQRAGESLGLENTFSIIARR
jgi:2-polyprenyl-3-methyl-5-hydroxy-6-metoxy-1,4-benzoquinol methylase